MTKKILMVVAPHNFRDEEFFEPKDMLERAGMKVIVACSAAEAAHSSAGRTIRVDVVLSDVNAEDYDAIVYVGGSGASAYFNNDDAIRLAKEFHSSGKVVAAICIAPTILANAGLLNGRRATAFVSEEKKIKSVGTYTGADVETDDKIITGKCPSAAKDFGMAIVKALKNQ